MGTCLGRSIYILRHFRVIVSCMSPSVSLHFLHSIVSLVVLCFQFSLHVLHFSRKKMFSKAALLCLESSIFLRWELFNRNSVTNTPQERKLNSEYYKLRDSLRLNPQEFFDYFNMSVGVYDYIYNHVKDRLDANVITIKTLSSDEKLFITLR